MVQFQELKITVDGQTLIVDVAVKDLDYYADIYLDTISIDTQDTYVGSGPSSNTVYKKTLEGDQKSIRLEIPNNEILASLKDNLLFVWVNTRGITKADTPCGMDNCLAVGVVMYPYTLYCNMLKVLQLESKGYCSVPKNFIDFYLKYKGLQLSLLTGSYTNAINYYKDIFKEVKAIKSSVNCNCYGN